MVEGTLCLARRESQQAEYKIDNNTAPIPPPRPGQSVNRPTAAHHQIPIIRICSTWLPSIDPPS